MIIDSFMFFDELDLLEIRLNELDPYVDKFVIVESLERHGSALPKSAVLADNWSKIRPFAHKVHYRLLSKLEPPYTDSASGWQRDTYNRSMLIQGIEEGASKDDIVMISDCDEIPRMPTVLANIDKIKQRLYGLRQDFFYYNVNSYIGEWEWGTVVGTLQHIQNIGGVQRAYRAGYDGDYKLKDGGWHFSYFGGVDRIKNKVASITHSRDEMCRAFLQTDNNKVLQDIVNRQDIYHRYPTAFTKRESNDQRLPVYFLKNIDKYKQFTEEYFLEEIAK